MTGKRVGLVIGNNYPNSNKELRFAVADALSMKEVLLNKDICGFDEVEESIDDTFVDARIKLEKLLKNANHDDLVFIYFSGHGKKHLDNGLRLLFKDAIDDYPLATSLNFDYINRCLAYPSLKSVIIVLDCCYSGVAGIKGDDLEDTFSNYSSGSGTVILASTGLIGSPKAKEDTELKHGVFTKYLLEGLENGGADKDKDGFIYVNDLYEYARSRTIKRSSQSPVMKIQTEGKILIARNILKVKEKEFTRKKNKLVKNIRKELPAAVYDVSMIVLVDAFEKPEELTETDEEIRNSLEDLLEGKICVKTYIHTVQCYLENEDIEGSNVLTKLRRTEIPKILEDQKFPKKTKANVTTVANNLMISKKMKNIAEPVVNYLKIPKTFTSSFTDMEFILIPEGDFVMGSPSSEEGRYDEGSAHKVKIKNSFYMGKYPVTQKQWEKVMENNPSKFKGEDLPIENVSWKDAQKFIKILNEEENTDKYSLPSETEWEYACRAGTQTRYSFGDNESKLNEYAWYGNNSGSETHPVGQKKSNSWDLYDMHGNVWEWVQDKWHDNYKGAPSDGSAWEDGNSSDCVLRGGSWYRNASDCCSSSRLRWNPKSSSHDLGFRLLKEL